MNRVEPANRTDAVTLKHDVDYMLADNVYDAWSADYRAIAQADNDLPGLATKLGLIGRSLIMPFSFYGGNQQQGKFLKNLVKTEPYWQRTFSKHDVDLTNW